MSLDDLRALKRVAARRWLGAKFSPKQAPGGLFLAAAAAAKSASRQVHAVGVGRKLGEGGVVGPMCVRFYVVQKLPASWLGKKDLLPPTLDGIDTDVIEAGRAYFSATAPCSTSRRQRLRPLPGGVSVAHRDVTAGTSAGLVKSRRASEAGLRFILSNNHVLANINAGVAGDAILQPGPLDGGVAADAVATLRRFVKLKFGPEGRNRVDAAIARVDAKIEALERICSIGRVKGTAAASEGLLVRKHGRTTGYTEGVIDDLAMDVVVGMDHQDPSKVAGFVDQLRITVAPGFQSFAEGGDSGSLVLRKGKLEAVALYFAGPPAGDYGIASPIDEVLEALDIDFV